MANLNQPIGGSFNEIWVPDGTTDANGKPNYARGVILVSNANVPTVTVDTYTGNVSDISWTFVSGAAHTIAAVNAARKFLAIQPLDNLAYVCFTGTATSGVGSFVLPPKLLWVFDCEFLVQQAISVFPTQSGDRITAVEG